MKKINKQLTLCLTFVLSLLFLAPSCTIQKRTYNKGYFIQWNSNTKISKGNNVHDNISPEESYIENESEIEVVSTFETTNYVSDQSLAIEVDTKETNQSNTKQIKESRVNKLLIKPLAPLKLIKLKTKSLKKHFIKSSPSIDGELVINYVLLLVFLALAIIFLSLALKALTDTMMIVYGIISLVAFIIFVTQVIDVIRY